MASKLSCGSIPLTRLINTSRPLIHLPIINSQLYFPINNQVIYHNLSKRRPSSSTTSGFGICRYPRNRAFRLLAFQKTEPTRKLEEQREMTIKPAIRISDGKLIVHGRTILTGVPDNVVTTSGSASGPVQGVFLGADFADSHSRHVTSLGTLQGVRFMACFRFKLWWMAQRMGQSGSEVPSETQFLLVESGSHAEPDRILYTVFLPLIEGPFRASLQGNTSHEQLELCLESGDADTKAASFLHSVFVHAGPDPFAAITEAVRAVKRHLGTFRQRHEKKLPGIVDFFGWCTWDAFYQEVTQEGVESGLESLTAGGAPPKFVIIDDGWQSVAGDNSGDNSVELQRLTGIKENSKFQTGSSGISNIVNIAKEKYGLKYVYVWHALTGYWGGVRPGTFGSELKYPELCKGLLQNDPEWKNDALALQGLGLVDPKSVHKFYNELHSYLASAGIDGVKVDVQCILETLGAGLGGRVELTRQYHQALDASVSRNFRDNGIIACMSHNTDALYCSKQTAVVRASDDFYPRDPVSHTIHIAAVAYNSVFLGEFMQPDWDMFHSQHPAAEYHASARAISGGPIYVSDAPGKHNFELLRKIVLPDGFVLRARLPGRPTQDCLFCDPARDGVSLLKIWNMNKYTGVLGVYNCQGAAWNALEKKNTFHQTNSEALTGVIRGRDVHLIAEAATNSDWNGDCAAYCNRTGELVRLVHNAAMPISLKVLEHEVFTVSPIRVLAPGVSFAPLGLLDMYNAGGAIEELTYAEKSGNGSVGGEMSVGVVRMEVKGCGKFGAYSSVRPRSCCVGSNVVDFDFDSASGLVTFSLDHMPVEGHKVQVVEVEL